LILMLAPAMLVLAACERHAGIAKPSDNYLTCADEPAIPEGEGPAGEITDEQDGRYKQNLRGAWYDCRTTVDYLRDWFSKLPD
jgi:hypothetical protein